MVVATFDTLKAAGVPEKQAEAQAAVLAEALAVNFKELVTKDDLSQALRETEQRLNAKIDLVRTELDAKFDGEIKLLKWMVGLCISLLIAVLVRLFFFRGA